MSDHRGGKTVLIRARVCGSESRPYSTVHVACILALDISHTVVPSWREGECFRASQFINWATFIIFFQTVINTPTMASTDNNPNPTKLDNPLATAPNSVEWTQTMELGYDAPNLPTTVCFSCGESPKEESSLSKCGKCDIASYCSRECQIKDWKQGRHRHACASYIRLAEINSDDAETIKTNIRNEIFGRIRFYACPYAVFKTQELGSGFLFIQSNSTLKDLSLMIPKNITGRTITRSVLMHFLTMGEYDSEVISDDFEMAAVRTKLQELVNIYDSKKEIVLLLRLRCGHVALGKGVLVPDYQICKKLGKDYYAANPTGAVQLNLDDI